MPFLSLLLFFFFAPAYAQDFEFEKLEAQLLQEFKDGKPSVDRQALVFQIVAQEFALYRNYPKAYEYHRKAIALKTSENKTPSYIDLIWLSEMLKQPENMLPLMKELEDYWRKNPKYANTKLQTYLEFLKKKTQGKWSAQDISNKYYGQQARQAVLKEHLAAKRYAEALTLVNPILLKEAGVQAQIQYDLLNVLVKKQQAQNLLCEDNFKKYPNAYSYSVKICAILLDYLQGGKRQDALIADLTQYFSTEHQSRAYLLEQVKDLGRAP